jgi:dihydrofolate reductase
MTPQQPEVLNVRKVVVYELLSRDGVAERPDGFFADWDEAMAANLAAVIAAQDAVILGRRSYEEWAEFWPGSDIEPFATFINGVTKYVATSTPLDRKWANAAIISCRYGPASAGARSVVRCFAIGGRGTARRSTTAASRGSCRG